MATSCNVAGCFVCGTGDRRLFRRFIVSALEGLCRFTHPVVHRRPWLWLPFRLCPLATLAMWLDERWKTRAFEVPPPLTFDTFTSVHPAVTYNFTTRTVTTEEP